MTSGSYTGEPVAAARKLSENGLQKIAQQNKDQVDTTLRGRIREAYESLGTIANSSGTLTGTQLSNAVRLMARVLRALVRLQLRWLDNED